MSPFPTSLSTMLTQTELSAIDRVFEASKGLSPDEKMSIGISLLGGALLNMDEFSQAKVLANLSSELRKAMRGIEEIQRNGVSPNATGGLQ